MRANIHFFHLGIWWKYVGYTHQGITRIIYMLWFTDNSEHIWAWTMEYIVSVLVGVCNSQLRLTFKMVNEEIIYWEWINYPNQPLTQRIHQQLAAHIFQNMPKLAEESVVERAKYLLSSWAYTLVTKEVSLAFEAKRFSTPCAKMPTITKFAYMQQIIIVQSHAIPPIRVTWNTDALHKMWRANGNIQMTAQKTTARSKACHNGNTLHRCIEI